MTDEGKSLTESWIDKQRAEYAYAYDKGGKIARFFGVRGIPHAILVDPTGKIVWRNHPAKLDDATLQKHLDGALALPVWDMPSSVRKALTRRKFADALKAAAKLGGEGAEIHDALETLVASRLAGLEKAFEAGDYLTAVRLGTSMSDELKGLEAGERGAEIVKVIKKDKQAKAVLKAQEQVAKMRAEVLELRKKKDADRLLKSLAKIADAHPSTVAATQADALALELKTLRRKLR